MAGFTNQTCPAAEVLGFVNIKIRGCCNGIECRLVSEYLRLLWRVHRGRLGLEGFHNRVLIQGREWVGLLFFLVGFTLLTRQRFSVEDGWLAR